MGFLFLNCHYIFLTKSFIYYKITYNKRNIYSLKIIVNYSIKQISIKQKFTLICNFKQKENNNEKNTRIQKIDCFV